MDKDVDLIMKEFALSKQEAYNVIKKHAGNMKEALIYILNHWIIFIIIAQKWKKEILLNMKICLILKVKSFYFRTGISFLL